MKAAVDGGLGNAPEYQIWELQGVLVREEYKLPWVPLSAMPGFEGVDLDGVDSKYFGKDNLGPFAYLVRMAPGVTVPTRQTAVTTMRFILSGSWTEAGTTAAAGWFEYKASGGRLAGVRAGDGGCLCLEIYQSNPRTTLG